MTKQKWKSAIKKACRDAGTYRKSFDSVIDTLADILAERDSIADQYNGCAVIEHTNSHGETNIVKNPTLMLWMDLNRDALAYWRDLGLTPAGLKRINEAILTKQEKGSSLQAALEKLGSGA